MDQQIISTWMRITNKILELEKIPRTYCTGQELYPSEIHTIQAIGDNHPIRVGSLAECMGITSGAVSQMVKKLSRRGLVSKNRGENEKEVFLSLTDLGQTAYHTHNKIHLDIAERIKNRTGSLSEEEYEVIFRMFRGIESTIDEMLEGKAHRVEEGEVQ